MGSIERYETAAGIRYRVRYRDPDRKSREKGDFARKRDAEEYLATVTVAAVRGEYINPGDGKANIGELGAAWLANQTHLKPSAYAPVESAWRVHVEPAWGRRRVSEVRFSEVQNWVVAIGRGRSATTVLRADGVLAAILDVAVHDKRLASNPARGVKLPRKVRKQRSYLNAAQVELLAAKAGDRGIIVHTLAYTGLRWGELVGLRVGKLDMLRRRLTIDENAVAVNSVIHVGTPKSHEARQVPFPAFLAEGLAKQCEDKTRGQLVFGDGDAHIIAPKSGKGWFWAAVVKAQAIDKDFPKKLTLHDLRHTAASLAVSSGANVKAVQRMLGHASAAMTLDTYADLFDEDLDAVSGRLDDVRARAVVGDLWGLEAGKVSEGA